MVNKSNKKISAKIRELPEVPGVYMFLDSKGRIIYVGKARRASTKQTFKT